MLLRKSIFLPPKAIPQPLARDSELRVIVDHSYHRWTAVESPLQMERSTFEVALVYDID